MAHVIEPAPTGRARCRGCGRALARGALRFGERMPNPFAEGETTLWFHPECAAYKRPEPLLEALAAGGDVPERELLERIARRAAAHRRLPRIDGAERAPSGQAKCRSCHAPIAKGEWRIRLVFYEEGLFSAAGSIHVRCRAAYFEVADVLDAVLRFTPNLDESARAELERSFAEPLAPPPADEPAP